MLTQPLLRARRFLPLFIAQTLGALNDNLFKNALVVLVLARAAERGPMLVAVAGGLFILPYAILSATAGQLADRLDKARLIRWTKLFELLLMALAAAGFALGSLPVLLAVLFGLGLQAALFSPLKFAILPAHLRADELVAGNGLIEAGTFGGILAGTIAGGALMAQSGGATLVSAAGLVVAAGGVVAAWFVPSAPPLTGSVVRIGVNPLRETVAIVRAAHSSRPIWLSILGLSWFWTVGATILTELPPLVRDTLGGTPAVMTLLLACFSVGIGIGSMVCARLLRGEVTARPVPFAALAMTLFLWDFTNAANAAGSLPQIHSVLTSVAGLRMLADLTLLATAGGIFSVPLYAVLQERSPADQRARMIAANNVVNAVAMAVAAAITAALASLDVSPPAILAITAAINLAVALWIVRLLPQDILRGFFRWYFTTFHRVRISGLENLRAAGERAVIVVNHLSFADGCFVGAFLPGSPLFAVNIHTARRWWARPVLAAVDTFLVDPANPFSTKTMVQAVRAGRRIVIFPEGRITITGALMKVYEGAGMVADKSGAVIVPVRIDGLQYSPLSRMGGKLRRRLFPDLSLTVLPPVAINVDDELRGRARRRAVGAVLQGVMEQSAFATADTGRTLFTALLDARARHGGKAPLIEDVARTPIGYDRMLAGACVLGRCIARSTSRGEAVGLLLPNANAAVVTFFAVQAFGRIPAMLNYTAGAEGMLAACKAAKVRTVLTSRAFVERGKLSPVIERMARELEIFWLEDLRAAFGLGAKLRGLLDARFARGLPGARADADAPAVVLFTSGSEGAPKGVVLSHRNILANIAQVGASVDFNPSDRVFNAMPMFHSFGLTGGTLLPVLNGVRTFLYPSPLHFRIVPELIYDTDATICFGTDTFLQGWARFAHPYDFHAMRYIFAGAERVRDETKRLYADRFGVRVLEGYGATETAPVIALNTPMHSRPGAAGRLLPGIEWWLEPVPGIETGGRLNVRGPNVMLGYLRTTAPGVLERLDDGWYDTGDIATVDGEGFVTLIGRAKRFAKIAGEMVSMPQAEALALALWPDAAHVVVAAPDPRKGERLVLLTTQRDATAAALLSHARSSGVAELMVPREVRVVPSVPLLGTGKVDYTTATKLAGEGAREAA